MAAKKARKKYDFLSELHTTPTARFSRAKKSWQRAKIDPVKAFHVKPQPRISIAAATAILRTFFRAYFVWENKCSLDGS